MEQGKANEWYTTKCCAQISHWCQWTKHRPECRQGRTQKFTGVSSSSNYSKKFQQRKTAIESDKSILKNDPDNRNSKTELNIPFSEYELKGAMRQLRNNTAPGENGISYECLKQLPGNGQRLLLRFFNLIWEKCYIPKEWKHAVVLPIPKAGKDPHDPSSYKPIALTSTMCKIMERLIANRLIWHLEKHKLLNNAQTGFRRNRSTIDQIIRLQDTINRSLKTAAIHLQYS